RFEAARKREGEPNEHEDFDERVKFGLGFEVEIVPISVGLTSRVPLGCVEKPV
ncbi:Hypothetical predicted protein, partial [Olea europaea subsp. europaea]